MNLRTKPAWHQVLEFIFTNCIFQLFYLITLYLKYYIFHTSLVWLLVIAFSLTFPVLFAKTWRLHHIASLVTSKNASLKTTSKSRSSFHYVLLGFMFAIYCPMVLWELNGPLLYRIDVTGTDAYGNPNESYGVCYAQSGSEQYAYLVVAVIFLSCMVGNALCFISRNDESVNNETTYISLGLINYFQIIIVFIPLIQISSDAVTRYTASVVGVFAGFGGLFMLIFLPKFISVEFSKGEHAIEKTLEWSKSTRSSGAVEMKSNNVREFKGMSGDIST